MQFLFNVLISTVLRGVPSYLGTSACGLAKVRVSHARMEWETVFLTFKNKVRAIWTNRIDKAKGFNSQRIYDDSSENVATLHYYIIKSSI